MAVSCDISRYFEYETVQNVGQNAVAYDRSLQL